jgi:predicted  nucleic acid-binding Zn-ribbon protein
MALTDSETQDINESIEYLERELGDIGNEISRLYLKRDKKLKELKYLRNKLSENRTNPIENFDYE